MQRRSSTSTRLAFVCFDALHIDDADLTPLPYVERRRHLEQLRLKHGHWLTTPSAQREAARALYGHTLAQGWEGIVAKRLDANRPHATVPG
ncbi:MAG: bifunctional non-ous end joining protein LigD [Gaiellales bacterium]|jgi:ATP-dependent DNA ligase|nr:bifunctional non-ous end joining protein LigD [Gaiellales bacterium]